MTQQQVARHVVVRGVVQGVYFEGPEEAVEQLVRWCHHGPPGARVDAVEVDEIEPGWA